MTLYSVSREYLSRLRQPRQRGIDRTPALTGAVDRNEIEGAPKRPVIAPKRQVREHMVKRPDCVRKCRSTVVDWHAHLGKISSYTPPHPTEPSASAQHGYAMTSTAAASTMHLELYYNWLKRRVTVRFPANRHKNYDGVDRREAAPRIVAPRGNAGGLDEPMNTSAYRVDFLEVFDVLHVDRRARSMPGAGSRKGTLNCVLRAAGELSHRRYVGQFAGRGVDFS